MNDLQTNSCMLYQEEHLKFMNQTETDSTDFLALWLLFQSTKQNHNWNENVGCFVEQCTFLLYFWFLQMQISFLHLWHTSDDQS